MKSDRVMKHITEVNSGLPQVGGAELLDGPAKDTEKPLPLRALLTRPVVVSVANYGVIGMLDVIAGALIPLVWSTSVEFGGLSMSPASIGLWMAGFGFMNGIFQFAAFPRTVGRFGLRRVFLASILCFFPVFILFPFENLALRHSSRPTTGLLIALQLSAISFADMGFSKLPLTFFLRATTEGVSDRLGVIFVYISAAAPNKRSLGATNGIAQMVVSIQRAVGPAAAASLFAFSLDHNILGGNFAYVGLLAIVCVGLGVALQLPKNTWKHDDEQ